MSKPRTHQTRVMWRHPYSCRRQLRSLLRSLRVCVVLLKITCCYAYGGQAREINGRVVIEMDPSALPALPSGIDTQASSAREKAELKKPLDEQLSEQTNLKVLRMHIHL